MSRESTGGIIERELFGAALSQERAPGRERMNRREAMALVRRMQPWPDPKEPGTDFTREVLRQYDELNPGARGRLSFFTAVGSIMDIMGVDGWFEDDDGRVVTVDLTTNPAKAISKADSTWPIPPGGLDRTLNEKLFLGHAKAMAQRVGQLLASNSREVRW